MLSPTNSNSSQPNMLSHTNSNTSQSPQLSPTKSLTSQPKMLSHANSNTSQSPQLSPTKSYTSQPKMLSHSMPNTSQSKMLSPTNINSSQSPQLSHTTSNTSQPDKLSPYNSNSSQPKMLSQTKSDSSQYTTSQSEKLSLSSTKSNSPQSQQLSPSIPTTSKNCTVYDNNGDKPCYEIIYKQGRLNSNADTLSRYPVCVLNQNLNETAYETYLKLQFTKSNSNNTTIEEHSERLLTSKYKLIACPTSLDFDYSMPHCYEILSDLENAAEACFETIQGQNAPIVY
ncbi:hypothetical protein JYU34_004702 [Plutella xylostella]|uniref:Uncharacterized protein n=1 Tax=Plutella xylostella TaxID=51655 RepID=A0ABQ7QYM4_PLUXY|nr:hypothetical protein JYU34_004702 [Plutella xylostella]